MSKVRELHHAAMQWAEKAMVARRQNDKVLVIDYSEKAFRLEAEAAALIPNEKASEPTRSILYCSAASLAFEAKCFKDAERLAIQGLAGFPSQRIETELKTIYEKVSFESHLSLNNIEINDEDFQLTLQGHAVANGFIIYEYFKGRFEALQSLIERTTQRLMNAPYKKGSIKKELKPFTTGISVARAGSYAVTIKLACEKQQFQLFVTPEQVISEIILCINAINESCEDSLKNRIEDGAYYNHLISMTKRLAPDGEQITGVGLTSRKSKVGLIRKDSEIPFPSTMEPTKEQSIEIISNLVGTLDLASAKPNKPEYLELTTENRNYRLCADEGLDEFVRSYYKQRVTVSGEFNGEYINLTDLRAA